MASEPARSQFKPIPSSKVQNRSLSPLPLLFPIHIYTERARERERGTEWSRTSSSRLKTDAVAKRRTKLFPSDIVYFKLRKVAFDFYKTTGLWKCYIININDRVRYRTTWRCIIMQPSRNLRQNNVIAIKLKVLACRSRLGGTVRPEGTLEVHYESAVYAKRAKYVLFPCTPLMTPPRV